MTQFDFGNLSSPLSGTSFIDSNLEPWRDALHSSHKGDSRPSYAVAGTIWIDDTNSALWGIYVFDGSDDIKLGDVDTSNNVFKPAGTSRYAGTTAGTANALTLSPTPAVTALSAGDVFDCIIGTTNTAAAPTLAISALDPDTIKVNIGSGKVNAPKGCLVAGTPARFLWDGTDFILMNVRPYNAASDIATAGTVNLDAALGDYVHLTGTTTVTAITLTEGQQRLCVADGIFTLTNGASLILPSGANITTAAGDVFVVRGESSGVVRVVAYLRASGEALVGGGDIADADIVEDGYIELTNGFIIQWGFHSPSSGVETLAFNTTFPNNCWVVTGTPRLANRWFCAETVTAANFEGNTGISSSGAASASDYSWIAIGN